MERYDGDYESNLRGEVRGRYDDYESNLKRMLGHSPEKIRDSNVFHHQTCPECGRTLVNLYRFGKEKKCRRCWGIK